jgi:group I intron endonuclease
MQKVTKELKEKSGIYCILNIVNNKIYIGSSKNLQERLTNHKIMLKNNKHYNNILQNSYNKYGEHNFIYNILEFCNIKDLIKKEQKFISNLDPYYNIIKNVTNLNITGKIIYQYDLNGNFLKKYDYIKHACKENDIHPSTICRFLNGEYKKGGGFLWSLIYKDKVEPYKKTIRNLSKNNKSISIFKDGKVIKIFKSVNECAKYLNCFQSEISKGIKNKRLFKKQYLIQYTQATLDGDI